LLPDWPEWPDATDQPELAEWPEKTLSTMITQIDPELIDDCATDDCRIGLESSKKITRRARFLKESCAQDST